MSAVDDKKLGWVESLLGRRLVRHFADAMFGRYAARRVRQLDCRACADLQHKTLLRLVRHAQHTRFGRDHDFGSIRSVADYQGRVPLRDYEAFWSEYWRTHFPRIKQATWPDDIPYFALSSGTTTGTTKYIPVSRQMLASNQRAASTALSLFLAAYPRTPLFTGRLLFLGGSTDLQDLSRLGEDLPSPAAPVLGGDLSGIIACEASPLLRPFTFPPVELALVSDWETKMDLLAQQSVRLPITMVSGVPSWLLVLFDRVRQLTGCDTISEVWPGLRLVIHGGTRFDPYRALFQRVLGNPKIKLLETYPASEGFIAAEDPRHGLLRLIPDHGIFLEFVPVTEIAWRRPTRHTVADLEVGVHYAVVLTTCAGLWSYKIGDTVCFERRDPPLFRFTGRTKYFLSAFGEHLISEEVEKAIAAAATITGAAVVDFHVGPLFPGTEAGPGRHRFLIEFAETPADPGVFATELDAALSRFNEDYAAHRRGDLAMLPPDVRMVLPGGFAAWMRSVGKLGGQHKVPRMDNTGEVTRLLSDFFGL
jgi:acyl-CoA synthetase (AMP-forming)/AMP-acid ligase II